VELKHHQMYKKNYELQIVEMIIWSFNIKNFLLLIL